MSMSSSDEDWSAVIDAQVLLRNSAELRPMEVVLKSYQLIQSRLRDAHHRLKSVQGENAKHKERCNGLEQQLRTLELASTGAAQRSAREEELETTVADLRRQVQDNVIKEKDYYKSIHEARQTQEENVKLRADVARLTEQETQREGVLRMLKNEYVALKQVNDVVQPKLQSLTSERDRCVRELLAAKDTMAKMQDRILEHEETINHMRRAGHAASSLGHEQHGDPMHNSNSSPRTPLHLSARQPVATNANMTNSRELPPPNAVVYQIDKAHGDRILYATCAADNGHCLLSGGGDRFIRHWNFASGAPLRQHTCSDVPLCIDSTSHYLLAGCADGVARFWDVNTLRTVELTGHSEKVVAAYLSQSASSAFTASSDRTIKLWDVRSSAMQRTIMCPSSCNDLCVADALIFSAHYNGSIWVWDRRASGPGAEVKRAHQQSATCVRLDHSGRRCVSLGRDGIISVRDVREMNRELFHLEHTDIRISTNLARLALSPDGRFCAVGNLAGDVLLFRVGEESSEGKGDSLLEGRLTGGHQKAVHSVVWTLCDNAPLIASIGEDKRVVVWK